MSDFVIRADDYSLQVTATGSPRFFVRLTSPGGDKTTVVFSDFILNDDDASRAVEVLHLVEKYGCEIGRAKKVVFQDVYPSYRDESDRTELVRRHDQIVAAVEQYACDKRLQVESVRLEPKNGKFETIVLMK